jgi:hypothetical protein
MEAAQHPPQLDLARGLLLHLDRSELAIEEEKHAGASRERRA